MGPRLRVFPVGPGRRPPTSLSMKAPHMTRFAFLQYRGPDASFLPQPLRRAALAACLALPGLALADVTPDVDAARGKVAMCIGCHGIPGYQASFPEVHKVPMISGQNAKYIAAALTAYQKEIGRAHV